MTMTYSSKGTITAPDGWRLGWDVRDGLGGVICHSPGNRDHVIYEEITPQYLARRIAVFVQGHCVPVQGVLV